ncbi:MAG TPA: methyltransferase domain-containing protein [Chloroflexi bacterium]|nr:methyltransferase domain-containing protein [Chloroflexota bacterium]
MDYYTYRQFAIEAHGHDVTIVGKPGVWSWDGLDPGTAALLEVADVRPGDIALDLGCGTGVIGAVASILAPQGRVQLVDCNLAALDCAEQTAAVNALANVDVRLNDGVMGMPPGSVDLVLSHLPYERAVQEELIRGAAWVLRPGGRFYFVAHKQAGVKGAIVYARELFGRCGVIRQKKGYHVAMTVRPAAPQFSAPAPSDGYVTRSVRLGEVEVQLVGKPGVFAWDRWDDGTAALVRAMEIAPGDRVLDLGCGTGLVGLMAARQAVEGWVVGVDADVRAVESARRTLEANGVRNGEVLLSDCGSAVFDRQFDVVITNPPFHQRAGGDDCVARQFVRDAARVLRRGGRLFLVANRFLRCEDLVHAVFGEGGIVSADNRYHVLTAVARKSGSG